MAGSESCARFIVLHQARTSKVFFGIFLISSFIPSTDIIPKQTLISGMWKARRTAILITSQLTPAKDVYTEIWSLAFEYSRKVFRKEVLSSCKCHIFI